MTAASKRGGAPTRAEFHEAIASRSDRWFAACLRITRSRQLAEDAVQEALLSAWRKRYQFEGTASLETWIHRIAVNAAFQLMRKERPERLRPLVTEMIDDAPSPEQDAADHDVGAVLTAAFGCLSDLERVCFVLKHLEQWRLKEIAAELDIDVGAVKQAIFRAVKKLRPRVPEMLSA